MIQNALIDERVMPDALQFQQAPSGILNILPERMWPSVDAPRDIFIVVSTSDLTIEGWRSEGYFTRAVARLFADTTTRVIESMWKDATGGAHFDVVLSHPAAEEVSAERAQAARRVERLTEIQADLGFSMQTFAEVLRVSRPQLYKWFDAEKLISLHKDSLKRLDEVEWLALSWRALSAAPLGPWVRERVDGDRSLLDLLASEPLPRPEIEQALSQIVARIAQRPKSNSARLREAGFARRASHRSLPSDE